MPQNKFVASNRRGLSGVFSDLYHGFHNGPLWRSFAWDEIKNRYRRSNLGLAWIGISYLFFVLVIVLFFNGLSPTDLQYFIKHVAIGYATFTFLIGNVVDGCDVFKNSTHWIKSTPLPYSIYIYKSIARSLFPFVIQLMIGIVIILFFGWRPTIGALYTIPAFIIFLINAVWVQLLFGLIATRFRDFTHLIGTITRILFFATPILWTLGQRGDLVARLALINPLTHYIEIFRAPLTGTPMMPESWPIVLSITLIGWLFTILSASIMLRRLPYWL